MPKISVIVPAYNIEEYIGKCMDSLVNQTLKDIEIIIVNDGSTDKTEEVIKEKIEQYKDKRILFFSKENGGQSDTRNFGIKKATGEYIAFVDGDDYVELDMFESMYAKTQEFPYDIVTSDVNCKYPDKDVLIKSGIESDKKELSLEDKKELILNMYAVVWNKIYKRELLTDDKLFMKGIWFEDVLFLYKLIPYINSIGIVEKRLYNYLQRTTSITYTYNEKLYDINKILKMLIEYYKEQELIKDYEDVLEYVYVRYMYATFIKRLAKCKDKEKFEKGVDFALQDVKKTFPDYKNNRYIKKGARKNIYLKSFNKTLANMVYVLEKNKMN